MAAARDHEASRRFVGRRPDRARQDRPHRGVPPDRQADGAGDGLAQSLSALLVGKPRPPCCFCGGRKMATKSSAAADVTRPSLSFKRRLNAPPAKVYAAWFAPKKIIQWFGPSEPNPTSFRAAFDAGTGGRFVVNFPPETET